MCCLNIPKQVCGWTSCNITIYSKVWHWNLVKGTWAMLGPHFCWHYSLYKESYKISFNSGVSASVNCTGFPSVVPSGVLWVPAVLLYGWEMRRRLKNRKNPKGSRSAQMSGEWRKVLTFGTHIGATVWLKTSQLVWQASPLVPKVSQTCLLRRSSDKWWFRKSTPWHRCILPSHLFFLLCRSIFFLFRIIS